MGKKVWAVVADSSTARIVKDISPVKTGDEIVLKADVKRLGEIMADKPGRSFSSAGAGRSAMELHSDPVRENERAFAREIATRLETHHAKGDFDALVVIAAPQMLGDIRDVLTKSVARTVTAELDKNLTKLPVKELSDYLKKQQSPGD